MLLDKIALAGASNSGGRSISRSLFGGLNKKEISGNMASNLLFDNSVVRSALGVRADGLRSGLAARTCLAGTVGAALMLALQASPAVAGPEGASVVGGSAVVSGVGTGSVVVDQATQRAIIDWRSYSVGVGESVQYRQPGAGSISLNRVTGGDPSSILGSITANGQVWLVNPAGIVFGESARVDVGGLVATTANIRNSDFMGGTYNFDAGSAVPGSVVVNRGDISVAEGGMVAFVAPGVGNFGSIGANLGRVALASGDAFSFDFYGDQLINLTVGVDEVGSLTAADGTSLDARIVQAGNVTADGGRVQLSVKSARSLVDNSINMSGVIQARTVSEQGGSIVLGGGDSGNVLVSGALDASGLDSGQVGGSVKVLGHQVGLTDGASVNVSGDAGGGEILIGGNFQGNGVEQNAFRTFVGSNVSITADAVSQGDGGRTIVWADDTTRFYGSITSRGGAAGGDGGFTEVSGKQYLAFDPAGIDLSAVAGASGTLLLDPLNITVDDTLAETIAALPAGAAELLFAGGTGTENVRAATLIGGGASVVLQATQDITITSALVLTNAGDTITMNAGRNISVNANVGTNNGAISLTANHDGGFSNAARAAGAGGIAMAGGTTINAGNQNINITVDDGASNVNSTVGVASLETLTTSADVTIDAQGAVTVSQAVGVNDVTITRSTGTTFTGNVTVNDLITTANSGTITLNGAANTFACGGRLPEHWPGYLG